MFIYLLPIWVVFVLVTKINLCPTCQNTQEMHSFHTVSNSLSITRFTELKFKKIRSALISGQGFQ